MKDDSDERQPGRTVGAQSKKLKDKHPTAHAAPSEALVQGEPPNINHIIFDTINALVCALSSKGVAGPSGLDAIA